MLASPRLYLDIFFQIYGFNQATLMLIVSMVNIRSSLVDKHDIASVGKYGSVEYKTVIIL